MTMILNHSFQQVMQSEDFVETVVEATGLFDENPQRAAALVSRVVGNSLSLELTPEAALEFISNHRLYELIFLTWDGMVMGDSGYCHYYVFIGTGAPRLTVFYDFPCFDVEPLATSEHPFPLRPEDWADDDKATLVALMVDYIEREGGLGIMENDHWEAPSCFEWLVAPMREANEAVEAQRRQ